MDEVRRIRSGLDERTFVLVRIAALAAVGGGAASWTDADRVGLQPRDVEGAIVAISPLIGTARATEAGGTALSGLGLAAMTTAHDEESAHEREAPDTDS